jgi:hypothetical protein
MFKKGETVLYNDKTKNTCTVCWFDSYAEEDNESCYVYPINSTWGIGIYTSIHNVQIFNEDPENEEYNHSLEAEIDSDIDWYTGELLN